MAYVTNRGTKAAPRWYAKYRDPAARGGWRQRHTHQLTRAAAQRLADEWEERVAKGQPAVPEPTPAERGARELTVLGLLEAYLQGNGRETIKDRGRWERNTRSYVRSQIEPRPLARQLAARVRPPDVQRLRDELRQDVAPATVNRVIGILAAAYAWALDTEVLPPQRNPAGWRAVGRLEEVPTSDAPTFYPLEAVRQLLGVAEWRPMLATALYTGCRKGELFGLTWEHVHLEDEVPWIWVCRSYSGQTKTKKPRAVPVHPELLPHLREWRQRCPDTPEQLVFPVQRRPRGWEARPLQWGMGRDTDMEGLGELLAELQIEAPADPWQACRHTLSTHLAEACGSEYASAQMLGHSQIPGMPAIPRVTRRYTHKLLGRLYADLCQLSYLPAREGVVPISRRRA